MLYDNIIYHINYNLVQVQYIYIYISNNIYSILNISFNKYFC